MVVYYQNGTDSPLATAITTAPPGCGGRERPVRSNVFGFSFLQVIRTPRLERAVIVDSDPLSEIKIYNRCAPSCVFAGANATHLAFAPFDGDLDFAILCCRPESGLRVGIGVLT